MPLLSKKLFLDLKYTYGFKQTLNVESVFDYNEVSQNYSLFNAALSTDYTFNNIRSTPLASLVFNTEKIWADAGAGYVFRALQGKDALRPELEVDNKFEAWELYARGSIKINSNARFYSSYVLRNEAPEIAQLLPNTNVSDPLNTITGNPNLKPSNNHSFNLSFNNYDYQKGTGFYSYINFDAYENAVVAQTTVDENNIRNTTYTNANGKYSLRGNVSSNKKFSLDSLRSIKPSIGVFGNYSQDVNFNNGISYRSNNLALSPHANVSFSWQKVFDVSLYYSLGYSKNSFEDNLFESTNYLSHSANFSTSLYVPKNFEWKNDIDYQYNADISPGFQKSAWFWNSTLAYSLLKEQATLTLKVYDLLNQNTNARRTSSENFIQDSQSTVLQQYFMLSFSYKFNTLGDKGSVKDNPWE